MRFRRLAMTIAATAALSAPALAQNHPAPVTDAEGRVFDAAPVPPSPMPPMGRAVDPRPQWRGQDQAPAYDRRAYGADYARQRDQWLAECRSRHADNGVGGALIGGVVGGLAGNRIAGRHDRTLGTVAGAAVGAIAGAVIDKSEDRGRIRDECEAWLDQYSQSAQGYGQQGYGYPAYGYSYGVAMMMVPVMQQRRPCRETIVTEEWVTVPARHRYIPQRRHIYYDKRVRMVPDKRIPMK
jgi:Glycine zipper 2TM domain